MTVHIGMVGLTAAGNFGDDLIALAVAQTVSETFESSVLHYVDFGGDLTWELPADVPGHSFRAEGHPLNRDLPFSRHAESVFEGCDAVVFGGGGLMQTTHHPERPYHWLRLLPSGRNTVPVLAVGLGLGPLSRTWQDRLRRWAQPFDDCYLRDEDSVLLARTRLRWDVNICRDFVDREFVASLGASAEPVGRTSTRSTLGVALRAWPNLASKDVAVHINQVASDLGLSAVRFYVLEATEHGPDIAFSRAVMESVTVSTSELLYSGRRVKEFAQDLAQCSAAISMKLHSSAVWSAASVPIYPISYAPKTASIFGVPFRGLQIFDSPLQIVEKQGVPRAQVVLRGWLERQSAQQFVSSSKGGLRRWQRVGAQVRSLGINLAKRARRFRGIGAQYRNS